MAITYEVNSTSIKAGIQADWKEIETGQKADSTQRLSTNWRRHIWTSDRMESTEYLVLVTLRGTSLTELKTTTESSVNATGTYSTAKLLTVSGAHVGRRFHRVRVEFLVDITS